MDNVGAVKHLLSRIYGEKKGDLAFKQIFPLIEKAGKATAQQPDYFSQKDVVLITYGDTMSKDGEAPLTTLHRFANSYLKEVFSTIHILPFYPFSSDDGFSVKDFFSVNSQMGSWRDVRRLGGDFKLMFDFVLNHISAKSEWFKSYLEEKEGFKDLAIETDPGVDLSMVTRPRSLPLLTRFRKRSSRTVHVWTTFSADQIDLNYDSVDVLEKMIEVLLFYVENGATLIRMDAIAYLWKEIGTTCVHLSQTHDMVKLFRRILDMVAPHVVIVTETNVPHEENISYFGDGKDEAQMVYNFTLPPLLLYSFVKEDSTILSQWAKELNLPSSTNTFFNFTASHDGIGVRPLEGILAKREIDRLIDIVKENGGGVSYKSNPDGSESPYELNIAYVDALSDKKSKGDRYHPIRFLASQAIQYALPGVPGTYIHSLIGSRNWEEGVKKTKRARTINRERIKIDDILSDLQHPEAFRSRIFYPYIDMARIRRRQKAFHPNADFKVLDIDPKIFGVARYSTQQMIVALTNVSARRVPVKLSEKEAPLNMNDLLTGKACRTDSLELGPYQSVWLSTAGI